MCGEVMIATGETPEAVRTGFRLTTALTSSRCSVGAASRSSVFCGTFGAEYSEQTRNLADSRSSRSISPAMISSTSASHACRNGSASLTASELMSTPPDVR
jgi:hypothetical protein